MTKKILAMLTIMVIFVLLVACGDDLQPFDEGWERESVTNQENGDINRNDISNNQQDNRDRPSAEQQPTPVATLPPTEQPLIPTPEPTPEPTPAPTPQVVQASNETELRAAVGQAGEIPTIVELTADIELISNFVIPMGTDITLTSVGDVMFSLIATRDMDVIRIDRDSELTIDNIIVTRQSGTTGRGIDNSGTFTMNNSIISGNITGGSGAAHNNEGGGVRNSGVFVMNSGSISSNNTTRSHGGGVSNNGFFTMYSGTISGNTANGREAIGGNGGGVRNNGTFTMYDGVISDNTAIDTWAAAGRGGGVSGSITMNGGSIIGNTAISGGGVSGSLTMYDGAISDNFATANGWGGGEGGGVNGYLTMHGGAISGNTATGRISRGSLTGGDGGGVRGSLTMYDGLIIDNTAEGNGGGVDTGWNNFVMSGGTITNNTASNGGGVNHGSGRFTFDGGWIFDNNTEDVSIGSGTFNNNVFDPNIGAIGSSPRTS